MVVLGSTGSIGVNTLELAKRFKLKVEALVAGNNLTLLQKQIDEFHPKYVAIAHCKDKNRLNHSNIFCGIEGILELLELSQSKLVVNALVGFAGLKPTLKAIKLKKKLALANKESLVVAGKFIDTSKITPIDSEHFGLWYLLNGRTFNKLYITASGGAFRDWKIEDIKKASFSDALKHPNWAMGNKITIDSASMVNKLFELLEARWLFNTTNVDAFIERNSMVHALIEFLDGSTTAHLSKTNMQLPIAYAILEKVDEPILKPINLLELSCLKFEKIEITRYPIWQIKQHLLNNPDMGVVLNGANEAAIALFEEGKVHFFEMIELLLKAYQKFDNISINSLEDIFMLDKEVRAFVAKK